MGWRLDQVQATLPPRSLRQRHTQVIRGVEFVTLLRVRVETGRRQMAGWLEAPSSSETSVLTRSAKEGRSTSAEALTQARS